MPGRHCCPRWWAGNGCRHSVWDRYRAYNVQDPWEQLLDELLVAFISAACPEGYYSAFITQSNSPYYCSSPPPWNNTSGKLNTIHCGKGLTIVKKISLADTRQSYVNPQSTFCLRAFANDSNIARWLTEMGALCHWTALNPTQRLKMMRLWLCFKSCTYGTWKITGL